MQKRPKVAWTLAGLASGAWLAMAAAQAGAATPPLTLRWRIGDDAVLLRSGPPFAGAVSSLRLRSQEYIDRADHGRELQGAIWLTADGAVINPTQAGSCHDPDGKSSSRLLWSQVTADAYVTRTEMAIWMLPGYKCAASGYGKLVRARAQILSGVTYGQAFRPGYRGFANAVEADLEFNTPRPYDKARVEAITAYMPPAFATFHLFDPADGSLKPHVFAASDEAEQDLPVVVSTADGRSAMAVLSLTDDPKPRYNGFVFADSSKWNLVFYPSGPYPAGAHAYRAVWVIGTRDEVAATLRGLTAK